MPEGRAHAGGVEGRARAGRVEKEAKQRDMAVNRRAYHDYFIDEKLEAGLILTGSEVKSVRGGRTNLRDGFVRIDGNDARTCTKRTSAGPRTALSQSSLGLIAVAASAHSRVRECPLGVCGVAGHR